MKKERDVADTGTPGKKTWATKKKKRIWHAGFLHKKRPGPALDKDDAVGPRRGKGEGEKKKKGKNTGKRGRNTNRAGLRQGRRKKVFSGGGGGWWGGKRGYHSLSAIQLKRGKEKNLPGWKIFLPTKIPEGYSQRHGEKGRGKEKAALYARKKGGRGKEGDPRTVKKKK